MYLHENLSPKLSIFLIIYLSYYYLYLIMYINFRKLGFTGSTEIGHRIMTSCAQSNLKKCSLGKFNKTLSRV